MQIKQQQQKYLSFLAGAALWSLVVTQPLAGDSGTSGWRNPDPASGVADSPLLQLAQASAGTQHTKASISQEIKKQIAKRFGLPDRQITPNTDLVKDLYADPMDAYEVLAILCEKYDVSIPASGDLTSVAAMTDYIFSQLAGSTADPSRTRGIGGSKGGQTRSAGTAKTGEKEPIYIQKIFYATDRKLTPYRRYGGDRDEADALSYGQCEVSIPVNVHKRGHLERPSVLSLQWREDPKQHIVLQKVEQLDVTSFLGRLQDAMSDKGANAFVFIHGFNVSFDTGARRTAQIAYDLDFQGAPIMYSWPSDGSMLSYFSDREDVEWSVPHLEGFLQDLLAKAKVKKLHLIAHSMGNQGLIRALHAISLRRGNNKHPLFENVILAAPDFDAQVFTDHLAPEIVSLAKRWTLYASDKDTALDASTVLAAKRLGLPLSVANGVDTIDATGVSVTPWSIPEFHSYYASKQRVIQDVVQVLAGLGPVERELSKKLKTGLAYWEL